MPMDSWDWTWSTGVAASFPTAAIDPGPDPTPPTGDTYLRPESTDTYLRPGSTDIYLRPTE
jgi:hypothetical protein